MKDFGNIRIFEVHMYLLSKQRTTFDYNANLAAFLSFIQRGEPKVSKEIHEKSLSKGFSLSPVMINGNNATWKLNIFDDKIANTLFKALKIWGITNYVQIGGYHFEIKKVEFRSERISFPNFFWSKVSFNFISPTTFRRTVNGKKFNYPIPAPDMVFSSLARKASDICSKNFRLPATLPITISKIENLKTSVAVYKKVPLKGFTGKVEYLCVGSKEEKKLFSFLTNLARYTGVGYKTTAGLGYVRVNFEGGKSGKT